MGHRSIEKLILMGFFVRLFVVVVVVVVVVDDDFLRL